MEGLPEVTQVHAWIIVDDDGTEGIAGILLPGNDTMTPLMCGDQPNAVAALTGMAEMLSEAISKDIKHYVFSGRKLV